MVRKYTLTRAQHAKLAEAMKIQYKAYGWRSAMDFGRAFYAQLIAQNA